MYRIHIYVYNFNLSKKKLNYLFFWVCVLKITGLWKQWFYLWNPLQTYSWFNILYEVSFQVFNLAKRLLKTFLEILSNFGEKTVSVFTPIPIILLFLLYSYYISIPTILLLYSYSYRSYYTPIPSTWLVARCSCPGIRTSCILLLNSFLRTSKRTALGATNSTPLT